MARHFHFTCDSCEDTSDSNKPDLPKGWADISIQIDGFAGWTRVPERRVNGVWLLCEDCQRCISQLMYRCRIWSSPAVIEQLGPGAP
ncbi:hypothetical protein [Mesorhizobium sp. M8A.F.Ca.ET.021.01.1.1]|uniref:hypothetical protein n=1 Tax=Mesorhizobium sp. M8A.F.Ca.ET.021.01.1.1 TaxID=2496757 RepID=UPI000FCA4D2F|nr:hypothetical protein [Mesorhizobium sp. M8A.F.Ca.ET.021.01.1.1]RUW45665.1 hypothetical protein EOA36_27665 [Mesorhizobium sp. M8A.F.Ca.ET.021.01.1.1]